MRPKQAPRGPRRHLPGGWSGKTLPVNAFVVEHPAGLCVFDTGQTARVAEPGYQPRWHPYLRLARFELGPEDELSAQLAADGLETTEVRWVVLSHLHTDHVGGVGAFPGARVLVSRIEWKRGAGLPGRLLGYVPHRWPSGLEPVLVDFDGPAVGPFDHSHDVTGDGRLLMVPLPGHTPGHAGLLVEGRILLAGDATETAEGFIVLRAHDPLAAGLAGAQH